MLTKSTNISSNLGQDSIKRFSSALAVEGALVSEDIFSQSKSKFRLYKWP
ncbi:hypothetical protein Fmac_018816 [Flemingia macrophylla]|uniref:Uncharacterized protein n=1 Tax=Flemingia macrophylla TaxID=520843 RepID=A0ABD1M835_9FABA